MPVIEINEDSIDQYYSSFMNAPSLQDKSITAKQYLDYVKYASPENYDYAYNKFKDFLQTGQSSESVSSPENELATAKINEEAYGRYKTEQYTNQANMQTTDVAEGYIPIFKMTEDDKHAIFGESYKTQTGVVDLSELTNLISKLSNIKNESIGSIQNAILNLCSTLDGSLNEDTKKKLGISQATDLYSYCLGVGNSNVSSALTSLTENIKEVKNKLERIDDQKIKPPSKHTHHHPTDHTDDTPENPEEPETPETPEEPTNDNKDLISIALGGITFSNQVVLYTSLGGEQINSDSETEYGIIGLEKGEDGLYYILIDKKTGKIYYTKVENVNYTGEGKEIIHTKDKVLLLSSADIGANDNFVKLIDPDKYYIVTETQEINGVKYATVIDPETGKNCFVPISENVEVLPFDQITNQDTPITSDETPTTSDETPTTSDETSTTSDETSTTSDETPTTTDDVGTTTDDLETPTDEDTEESDE